MHKSLEQKELKKSILPLNSLMNGENEEDKKKYGVYQQMTPDIRLLTKELLIRLSKSSIGKFP